MKMTDSSKKHLADLADFIGMGWIGDSSIFFSQKVYEDASPHKKNVTPLVQNVRRDERFRKKSIPTSL